MRMNAPQPSEGIGPCSFCHKQPREVQVMIAGPGVWICGECIEWASEILSETQEATSSAEDANPQPD
jgi:ATP-dependent protease Clp ATPase subunit